MTGCWVAVSCRVPGRQAGAEWVVAAQYPVPMLWSQPLLAYSVATVHRLPDPQPLAVQWRLGS